MQEKAWARFKPIRNEGYAEHRNVEEALEIALSDIPFSKNGHATHAPMCSQFVETSASNWIGYTKKNDQ